MKGEATAVAAVAKTANKAVAHQKRMSGLNNVINLTVRVGVLERMVGYLQRMLQELGELMTGIVDDSILVASRHGSGSLGTAGTVTRADFEGYKAEQECTLAILAQKIEGVNTLLGCLYLPPWRSQFCMVRGTSHLIPTIVFLGS